MNLFQNVGFELFFVAEIRLVTNLFLPDDETVAYNVREVLLGLVDRPRFLIAVFESVCPK